MQCLYAFKSSELNDVKKGKTFLLKSINGMYDLYLSIMALLIELQEKSKIYNKKLEEKLSISENNRTKTKLEDNQLLHLICQNPLLKSHIEKRKLNHWHLDFEYVDILFRAIINSDLHKQYSQKADTTFNEDKQFLIDVYTTIIAPNDKLYDYFEDKQLTWVDDLPIINTNILKLFNKIKLSSPQTKLVPELYKDDDDKIFATDLLKKTLLNTAKFSEEIVVKTKNWEADRLATLDGTLLKMAICEFQKFPFIPYKVTINEYLEIAKAYSTPKSSIFINGVLDKIVKEYQTENIHLKTGRGLM